VLVIREPGGLFGEQRKEAPIACFATASSSLVLSFFLPFPLHRHTQQTYTVTCASQCAIDQKQGEREQEGTLGRDRHTSTCDLDRKGLHKREMRTWHSSNGVGLNSRHYAFFLIVRLCRFATKERERIGGLNVEHTMAKCRLRCTLGTERERERERERESRAIETDRDRQRQASLHTEIEIEREKDRQRRDGLEKDGITLPIAQLARNHVVFFESVDVAPL
jgi:hypothetical protein